MNEDKITDKENFTVEVDVKDWKGVFASIGVCSVDPAEEAQCDSCQ